MDVLVRNVKPATKLALVERAKANGRSLQAELLEVLELAAAEPTSSPEVQPLRLVLGHSKGESTWGRDEIYEASQ